MGFPFTSRRERGARALDRSLAAALRVMADEHALDGSLAEWATEIA